MPSIVWNENLPSDGSDANTADNEFRSFMSSVAYGLGRSFFWPGSAASQGASTSSTGEMRPGSARLVLYAPGSGTAQVITSRLDMPDGFLGFVGDDYGNATLWHLGSSQGTYVLSSGNALVAADAPGNAPFTSAWLIQEGTIDETTDADNAVVFDTAYDGEPNIIISRADTQALNCNFGITTLSKTGFTLTQTWTGSGGAQAATYRWTSEGTATL